MRFGLQEILIILIIANAGKDFKDGMNMGSVKQLRKTPKTKKEQSCKIVVSNKTK